MTILDERLKHYEIEIEIFDINTIEEEISQSYFQRLLLSKHKKDLTYEDLERLYKLDIKAVELYNSVKDKDTIAVEYLGKIVNEFANKNIAEYEKSHKQKRVWGDQNTTL